MAITRVEYVYMERCGTLRKEFRCEKSGKVRSIKIKSTEGGSNQYLNKPSIVGNLHSGNARCGDDLAVIYDIPHNPVDLSKYNVH
jgi:hypothetical protein